MKCPKCHYLSFDPEVRCKNCGYDFALADGELTIRPLDEIDESKAPLADFELHARPVPLSDPPGPVPVPPAPITLGLIHAAPEKASEPAPLVMASVPDAAVERPGRAPVVRQNRPPSTSELPLFMRGAPDTARASDTPLVHLPAVSRPPLSVRRRTHELTAEGVRGNQRDADEMAEHVNAVWAPLPEPSSDRTSPEIAPGPAPFDVDVDRSTNLQTGVTVAARVKAALIDFTLLGAINLGVVWLTVRVCALGLGDALTLPILPLAAFLSLVNIGYLLLFTAVTGQTLGKMAAGIRVVADGDADGSGVDDPLTFRQAIIREVVTLPSVVALGAGFLPALSAGGLAIHDRIAHTRVVRA